MMTVQLTCPNCGSGAHIYPQVSATYVSCEICQHSWPLSFSKEHEQGIVRDCPQCQRKDFYIQKDFNRKIGVVLFVIAAILSIWTYGISLIVLYLCDLLLFKKLGNVVACYKCHALFRGVSNQNEIRPFDHEMNDRIAYSNHDFEGRPLSH